MDALYLLIPISIFLLVVAIAIFFWAVNSDQYSDLDKEAHRILFDAESSEKQSDKGQVGEELSSKDLSNKEQSEKDANVKQSEQLVGKKKDTPDD